MVIQADAHMKTARELQEEVKSVLPPAVLCQIASELDTSLVGHVMGRSKAFKSMLEIGAKFFKRLAEVLGDDSDIDIVCPKEWLPALNAGAAPASVIPSTRLGAVDLKSGLATVNALAAKGCVVGAQGISSKNKLGYTVVSIDTGKGMITLKGTGLKKKTYGDDFEMTVHANGVFSEFPKLQKAADVEDAHVSSHLNDSSTTLSVRTLKTMFRGPRNSIPLPLSYPKPPTSTPAAMVMEEPLHLPFPEGLAHGAVGGS